MKHNIVIVDICGTLFYANTTFGFLDYCISESAYLRFRRAMKTKVWRYFNSAVYRSVGVDMSRRFALRYLRGYKKEELKAMAERYYDDYLKEHRIERVWNIVQKCLDEEDNEVILVSGTIDVVAKVVAQKMNIDRYVSSELEYDNGICCGRLKKDNLGTKKLHLKNLGVLSPYSVVVTDNFADAELLKCSENKYVVTYGDEKRWHRILRNITNVNYIQTDEQSKVER